MLTAPIRCRRLGRQERNDSDDGSRDDEQRRIDFVLQEHEERANRDRSGFESKDRAFRHGEAASQEQSDRDRRQSFLNRSPPRPMLSQWWTSTVRVFISGKAAIPPPTVSSERKPKTRASVEAWFIVWDSLSVRDAGDETGWRAPQ